MIPSKMRAFGMLVFVVLVACLGAAQGRTCESHQFWSAFFNKCINCTECAHPEIVVKPCQGHRDTVCGPLSALQIDWSWMKHRDEPKIQEPIKEMTQTFKENMKEIKMHERHVKEKEKILRKLQDSKIPLEDIPLDVSKQELWNKLKSLGRPDDLKKGLSINSIHDDPLEALHLDSEEGRALLKSAATPKVETKQPFGFFPVEDSYDDSDEDEDDDDDDDEDDDDNYNDELIDEVSEQPIDFTTTEKVILDYQAGVLYLAVGSVLVFFVVALCYSLKHLRSWSGRNYVEELEELQFWLTKNKDGKKQLPATIYKTTTEVVSEGSKGNCKYLERIISKNAKKKNRVPSNVYSAPHMSLETRPLTDHLEDPEVHKPVNI